MYLQHAQSSDDIQRSFNGLRLSLVASLACGLVIASGEGARHQSIQ